MADRRPERYHHTSLKIYLLLEQDTFFEYEGQRKTNVDKYCYDCQSSVAGCAK